MHDSYPKFNEESNCDFFNKKFDFVNKNANDWKPNFKKNAEIRNFDRSEFALVWTSQVEFAEG